MRRFISIAAACGAVAMIASKPAPAPNARAEQLVAEASRAQFLAKYHYMSAAKSEDFERLEQVLHPRANSEAAFLIDNLIVSDRVYRYYRPTDTWTIVDLRSLRTNYRRIAAALHPDQRDQFARLVFGFDAALYLGGMRPATFEHNPGVAY